MPATYALELTFKELDRLEYNCYCVCDDGEPTEEDRSTYKKVKDLLKKAAEKEK